MLVLLCGSFSGWDAGAAGLLDDDEAAVGAVRFLVELPLITRGGSGTPNEIRLTNSSPKNRRRAGTMNNIARLKASIPLPPSSDPVTPPNSGHSMQLAGSQGGEGRKRKECGFLLSLWWWW